MPMFTVACVCVCNACVRVWCVPHVCFMVAATACGAVLQMAKAQIEAADNVL